MERGALGKHKDTAARLKQGRIPQASVVLLDRPQGPQALRHAETVIWKVETDRKDQGIQTLHRTREKRKQNCYSKIRETWE